jgi:hypothetical protein
MEKTFVVFLTTPAAGGDDFPAKKTAADRAAAVGFFDWMENSARGIRRL